MSFWSTVSNIGVLPEDKGHKLRYIQLLNQMCFLGTSTGVAFIPYFIMIGHYYYVWFQMAASLLSAVYILFNLKRLFNFSFGWIFTVIFLNIFYASIEIPKGGIEYFYIPLCFVVFVVTSNRRLYITLVVLIVLAFFLSHWMKTFYVPHEVTNEIISEITFLMLISSTFLLCTLIVLQLKTANTKYEKIVEEQVELLAEKNKEITDSIQYAKRIQTSLITSEKYIEKTLEKLNPVKKDRS